MSEFLGPRSFDSRIFSRVTGVVDGTMKTLLSDVAAGIRVLQSRDGLPLTETQIRERARNIVMGLLMNYRIDVLEDEAALAAPSAEPEPSPHPFLDATAP